MDQKPRQNSRNQGYQAYVVLIEVKNNSTPGDKFNLKQSKQLYKMFSSL